jgi:DNA-binding MarR family transcriptional regulator
MDDPPQWSSILSPRERKVALLIARGLTNKKIARDLGLKPGTVTAYVHRISLKLRQFLTPRVRLRELILLAREDLLATESAERQRAESETRRGRERRISRRKV